MTTEAEVYNALKYHVVVDSYGTRRYYNSADQLHRDDGPAVKRADGGKEWWLHGERNREDGPAIEWPGGTKEWWQNGLRHRINGPAVEHADGGKEWWINGKSYTKQEYQAQL